MVGNTVNLTAAVRPEKQHLYLENQKANSGCQRNESKNTKIDIDDNANEDLSLPGVHPPDT